MYLKIFKKKKKNRGKHETFSRLGTLAACSFGELIILNHKYLNLKLISIEYFLTYSQQPVPRIIWKLRKSYLISPTSLDLYLAFLLHACREYRVILVDWNRCIFNTTYKLLEKYYSIVKKRKYRKHIFFRYCPFLNTVFYIS